MKKPTIFLTWTLFGSRLALAGTLGTVVFCLALNTVFADSTPKPPMAVHVKTHPSNILLAQREGHRAIQYSQTHHHASGSIAGASRNGAFQTAPTRPPVANSLNRDFQANSADPVAVSPQSDARPVGVSANAVPSTAATHSAAASETNPCTCPLCATGFSLPCGQCPQCKTGFPCQELPCRHCVQPRDLNMCSFCDLTAGDEPCGTCDSCMEHRSSPCEHADDGHGPKGEFNPYHQNPMFATPSRIWTGHFNNGAHRFPIYYNPAPYYRPTWNPAMFGGYMRPFTFRWVCEYCHFDVCQCNTGPRGGQTSFGYQCVFCKRNPCACPPCICDVTHEMDVKGKRAALEKAERDRQDAIPKLDDTAGTTGTAGATPATVTPTTTDGAAQTLHGDEDPEELEFPDEKKPNDGFVDKLEFDQ